MPNETLWSRRSILGGAVSLLALQLGGCSLSAKPRLVCLLRDQSASVTPEDWNAQDTTVHNVVYSLEPSQEEGAADRLIVAPIGDQPLSRLNIATTGMITYEGRPDRDDQIEAARKKLIQEIGSDQPTRDANQTRIFDSLAAAADFGGADETRTFEAVIVSDMLESSPIADFEREVPDEAATVRILAQLKTQGLLPDFRKAKVYVTGGGGKDGAVYQAVKRFWIAYFSAANAELVRYVRTPLDFPAAETS